jgi:hypothetical protein
VFSLEGWKLDEVKSAKFNWEWRVHLKGRYRRRSVEITAVGRCSDATEQEAEEYAREHYGNSLSDSFAVIGADNTFPIGILTDDAVRAVNWRVDTVSVQPIDPVVERMGDFRDWVNMDLQLPIFAYQSGATEERQKLWDHVCGFLDVMDDAANAIVSFLLDGIEGSGRRGESFLRLSGVLVCACNQQQAFVRLYKQLEETSLPSERTDLTLKAWGDLYKLRNWIAVHSLGNDFITTHVPSWTEGYYVGIGQVNTTTRKRHYNEKIDLQRLLKDWQEDVLKMIDDIQPRLERAVRGDDLTTPTE